MHLDRRGYAYKTFREGGRVCRRYLGNSGMVLALCQLDALERERAENAKREQLAQVEQMKRGTDKLSVFCAASNALLGAQLTASGFYRHKRGAWRKKRASLMAKSTKAIEHAGPESDESSGQNINKALLVRAHKGDKAAIEEFLAQVANTPQERAVLDVLAPLSGSARDALIGLRTKSDFQKQGFRRQLDLMRDEIAGPNPSALERQLAERVALCFFQVVTLESIWSRNIDNVRMWQAVNRQLDGAHRRHLSAIKALAEVRRLKLPSVQVNIGEKQVNIA